jgi:hypothetical protein
MECGSQDVVCQLTTWLSENELVASWLVESIGRIGANASGILGALSQFAKDYGQALVGLFGVSFGFWRWWRYREHILHKRLAEYLRESDARLVDGTAQLIDAIRRPAPGQRFEEPLFADDDLRTVLRGRNWDNAVFAPNVETSADWLLGKAIESIEWRLKTAHDATASLHRQLCCAYSIKGAVAASRADRSRDGEFLIRALNYFRSALSVPGSDKNIIVRELEAHQQRKLGLATARQAYEDLIELASGLEDSRERDILTARAKRFAAEIEFLYSPWNAWLMMTAANQGAQFYPGALHLMGNQEPLSAWERLEKGDMHYFAALCANRQVGFAAAEPAQLDAAEEAYQRILIDLSDRRFQWPQRYRRLRARAKSGIRRVKDARNGTYDVNWLPA